MNSKLQIFVSSTYLDLKDERQSAVESILRAGHIPAGMELFTSGDQTQWTIIKRWIDACDIYVLILGGRYGAIEPNSGLSYTELEYDYALANNKPYFSIVINDQALEDKIQKIGIKNATEQENPHLLKLFKEKVLGKISTFFSDNKDIRLSVMESIANLSADYDLKGWVRYESVSHTQAITEELSRLQETNKSLQLENTKLRENIESQLASENPFNRITRILKNHKIDHSSAVKDMHPSWQGLEPSAFSILQSFRNNILKGIKYTPNNSIANLIHNKVCPILQVHGLVQLQTINGQESYSITEKGLAYYAHLDELNIELEERKEIKTKTTNEAKAKNPQEDNTNEVKSHLTKKTASKKTASKKTASKKTAFKKTAFKNTATGAAGTV